jgi:MoaA/NifB/PqqE/SkfB family radical SAM enzyme
VSAASSGSLASPASSTSGPRTRRCACGVEVAHVLSGREALEREPCPACGADVLFTSYQRMDIALSEYCNLTCQMCRRPSEALFMDKELCKRTLTEARDVGIPTVSFSGGEPFVHPAIEEILAHAFSLGVKVQLVTNGTLIKRDKLEFLSQLDCMTVSVDGLEDAHDFIRQRQGTFKRTERTLRWLAETQIQWGTNTVMQRDNAHQLYDLFKHVQSIGGKRYAYCGFSHVEVVPETEHLQMTPEQEKSAHQQLVRIERECKETHTWFNQREQLLEHFELYARKNKRYRPLDGCKIPQKFIGFSDHGFYLCWHQGRNIKSDSLVAALSTDLARDIVREGLEKRCVACNSFNYAWDDEWNAGMRESALRGQNVASGVVALRVPARAAKVSGPSTGNTIAMHDDG